MRQRKVIRNIPTKNLLLLLAQANYLDCPYVDLNFDVEKRSVGVTPISKQEFLNRFSEGSDGTNMEDIISES